MVQRGIWASTPFLVYAHFLICLLDPLHRVYFLIGHWSPCSLECSFRDVIWSFLLSSISVHLWVFSSSAFWSFGSCYDYSRYIEVIGYFEFGSKLCLYVANVWYAIPLGVLLLAVEWIFLLGVLIMFVVLHMWWVFQYFDGSSYLQCDLVF